jgi:hypothetical protein
MLCIGVTTSFGIAAISTGRCFRVLLITIIQRYSRRCRGIPSNTCIIKALNL